MRIDKTTLPACPACARPMQFIAQSVEPTPATYRCKRCRFLFSEFISRPGGPTRAMDLNFSPSFTMH